jgi:hypothetical protein
MNTDNIGIQKIKRNLFLSGILRENSIMMLMQYAVKLLIIKTAKRIKK